MSWKHYKALIVWQKAMDLTDEIYRLVKSFPKEEQFSLSDQLRRRRYPFLPTLRKVTGDRPTRNSSSFFRLPKVLYLKPKLNY